MYFWNLVAINVGLFPLSGGLFVFPSSFSVRRFFCGVSRSPPLCYPQDRTCGPACRRCPLFYYSRCRVLFYVHPLFSPSTLYYLGLRGPRIREPLLFSGEVWREKGPVQPHFPTSVPWSRGVCTSEVGVFFFPSSCHFSFRRSLIVSFRLYYGS